MSHECTYQDFMECRPAEFDGKSGALAYLEWIDRIEMTIYLSKCPLDQRVNYVSGTLRGTALSWWDTLVRTMGRNVVTRITWDEFKEMMREEFYPRSERLRMEKELLNHRMRGKDHVSYTNRFQELSKLVPHLVTPMTKQIE